MIRTSITLPARLSRLDGAESAAVHDALHATLLSLNGGYSVREAGGWWGNGGDAVFESVRVYECALPLSKLGGFLALAERVLQRSQEDALYIEVGGERELLYADSGRAT